jgi:hypothetical protein
VALVWPADRHVTSVGAAWTEAEVTIASPTALNAPVTRRLPFSTFAIAPDGAYEINGLGSDFPRLRPADDYTVEVALWGPAPTPTPRPTPVVSVRPSPVAASPSPSPSPSPEPTPSPLPDATEAAPVPPEATSAAPYRLADTGASVVVARGRLTGYKLSAGANAIRVPLMAEAPAPSASAPAATPRPVPSGVPRRGPSVPLPPFMGRPHG